MKDVWAVNRFSGESINDYEELAEHTPATGWGLVGPSAMWSVQMKPGVFQKMLWLKQLRVRRHLRQWVGLLQQLCQWQALLVVLLPQLRQRVAVQQQEMMQHRRHQMPG